MQTLLPRHIHVSVLRGGTSSEYPLSLETGGSVLRALENNVHTQDVFIDRIGKWHVSGIEKDPSRVLSSTSVAFNALHGGVGENGHMQKLLERYHVPYSGSRALSSALSLRKGKSRDFFKDAGLRIPTGIHVHIQNPEKQGYDIFKELTLPLIIKKPDGGSSHDTHIAFSYNDILSFFEELNGETVLIEKYIIGTPVSCGVIEGVRDENLYSLFPVEIEVGEDPIFYHDKRAEYTMKCPSHLSRSVKRDIQDMARQAHKVLGLNHYSQSDFVVTPTGSVYLLETNALPSLTPSSSFVLGLESNAIGLDAFLHHVLGLALAHK